MFVEITFVTNGTAEEQKKVLQRVSQLFEPLEKDGSITDLDIPEFEEEELDSEEDEEDSNIDDEPESEA